MESVYKHCHFHRPVFRWRNCWTEYVEPFCKTRRGNGGERQAQSRRIEHGLCLDICPSICAIFTRLATASAVFTQHLVRIWKKTSCSCLSNAHSSVLIGTIQVPNPRPAFIKNYFAFRRSQFRFLPMRSATLARILMHFFPSPFYVHLKREEIYSFLKSYLTSSSLYLTLYELCSRQMSLIILKTKSTRFRLS
jgi:hypothetical protein